MGMFSTDKGTLDIVLEQHHFIPGDVVSGMAQLKLFKPVKCSGTSTLYNLYGLFVFSTKFDLGGGDPHCV